MAKRPKVDKNLSNQGQWVKVDLSFPRLVIELQKLELADLQRFEGTIEKIKKMTWEQIYKTSAKSDKRGLNWELISGQKTRSGRPIASIRISKKFRARVCRDGVYMRFISLHPDHDSAYDEDGGEDI